MKPPPTDIVDRHKPLVVEVEADVCDECGVPAFVYAELPSGRSLAWCGHHGGIHIDKAREDGATVIDLRHLIGP